MIDDLTSASTIELAQGVRVSMDALRIQFSRSSGPGGQNVNKLNTKAELWIALDVLSGLLDPRAMHRLEQFAGKRITKERTLHVVSESHRSQEQNRQEAIERLRELVERAIREPKMRRKTKPSRGAKRRRLEAKKRRSNVKALRRGEAD